MTQEDKQLLLKDLCARLPYGVKVHGVFLNYNKNKDKILYEECDNNLNYTQLNRYESLKPYLRLMSDMTEEEAREITKLSGILIGSENILSISVKEKFIDIKIDDGVCSTETRILWFTDMPTSITQLDYLNAHHFDYRGLIEKGFALKAPKGMYNI